MSVSFLEIIMEQLRLTYFFPLTEQPELDLDYTPCRKYEENKLKNRNYIGNRVDQWGVVAYNGQLPITTSNVVMNDPRMIIYPDSVPITIRTKDKPSILARWVYKILGAKWEKA